ncbi:ribonuclease P protein component [Amorphus orientalis]|uniref:Ribonuclease P protein component n=1 Tax=Amorphus orientalis TaxID=649198 RepID=A0AAE3VPW4_9HYPH|nr:ribonuclease P protein component [Amorphus orientalis]MDQ0316659.1 ribonuclease P protein component [Amorphus orientalis]
MMRLKKRAEFKSVARGVRAERPAFVLQARCEPAVETPPRFGFTVTKKTGNSVERNRIRRRLKAAVDERLAGARSGCAYVLVGRRAALSRSYADLLGDLELAFERVHNAVDRPAPRRRAPKR